MKSYIKGVITGFAAGLALTFTFAMADNIEVALNRVRLNINGVDKVQWGENITASDGVGTPSSLLYNGTTYLPMRKLGEWYGKKVYWNGDSATVSVTGEQSDINELAEKPDADGNVWTYYTFNADDNSYLGVKDKARDFERIYRLETKTVRVTDEEIYFVRYYDQHMINGRHDKKEDLVKLIRLPFDNDANNQDGEIVHSFSTRTRNCILDGEYVYSIYTTEGTMSQSYLCAYNYITHKGDIYNRGSWTTFNNLELTNSSADKVKLLFVVEPPTVNIYKNSIVFDKTTDTFDDPVREDGEAK